MAPAVGLIAPMQPDDVGMNAPERIETARLNLTRTVVGDATGVFDAYCQDEDVTRYLVWKPHSSIDETRKYLSYCEAQWRSGETFTWTIRLRDNAAPAGMISVRLSAHTASMGFVLARPWWGQGLMTEAATVITNWSLARPDIYRVTALCAVENVGSAKVLERAGMSFEGTLRRALVLPNLADEPWDCFSYAKVKA